MYLWSPYNQHARADPRMLHQKLFFSWKFRAQAATCLPYKHWYPHHKENHEPIPPTQWEYGWIYMLLLLLPELKSPEQPQDTWLLKNQGQGNTGQPSAKARWTGAENMITTELYLLHRPWSSVQVPNPGTDPVGAAEQWKRHVIKLSAGADTFLLSLMDCLNHSVNQVQQLLFKCSCKHYRWAEAMLL